MKLIKLWEADLQKAYELYRTFDADENGFINPAYGMSFEEFKEYVQNVKNSAYSIGLKEGYVPDTSFVLSDNDVYVGVFKLRHYLNDILRAGSGHIGFGISKAYRGKGYASNGLALVIEEARQIIPEDEIYMSVNKNNTPSLKAQLKNGAYIHHEDEGKYYTRIKKQHCSLI